MRIEKSIFRYIEHELYNYEDTKKELEGYKLDIIESTNRPETSVMGGRIGDTTGSKAIKLTTSKYILKSEKVIRAVEKGLGMLTDEHRELFSLRYQDCMSMPEIIAEMHISERNYYRKKREIVAVVGQELGLINWQ